MRGYLHLVIVLTFALGCADGVEVERPYPSSMGGSTATTWSASVDEGTQPTGGSRTSLQIDSAQSSTNGLPFTGNTSVPVGIGGRHSTSGVQSNGGLSPWSGIGGAQHSTGGAKASGGSSSRIDLGGQHTGGVLPLGSLLSGISLGGNQQTVRSSSVGGTPITGASANTGDCCPNKDCLCHGPAPGNGAILKGPFKTANYAATTGTIHYPSDAAPPFAGVALCGGFTNTGPEMAAWGTFYASWGIVTLITTTGALDVPDLRATALLNSIKELKAENNKSGSPLFNKMSDRYGISGYSMGGGGTTIASKNDPSLKTGVGLAPWGPVTGMKVPTLFLCGSVDTVAGVSEPSTAAGTPSMQVVISGYTHMSWFGPSEVSGHYALSWQKVYLEGDQRWAPLLSEKIASVASMKSTGL
ncbi:MAG: hypothetical protein ACM3ZE_16885 [Myxococcales bacterium]